MRNSFFIKYFFLIVGLVFFLFYIFDFLLHLLSPLVHKWIGTIGFLFLGIDLVLYVFFSKKNSLEFRFISEQIIEAENISNKIFKIFIRIIFGTLFISAISLFLSIIYGIWVAFSDYHYIVLSYDIQFIDLPLFLSTFMIYESRKQIKRKKEIKEKIREENTSKIRDWLLLNDYIINDENTPSLMLLISNLHNKRNIYRILKTFPEVQDQLPEIKIKLRLISRRERNIEIMNNGIIIMIFVFLASMTFFLVIVIKGMSHLLFVAIIIFILNIIGIFYLIYIKRKIHR